MSTFCTSTLKGFGLVLALDFPLAACLLYSYSKLYSEDKISVYLFIDHHVYPKYSLIFFSRSTSWVNTIEYIVCLLCCPLTHFQRTPIQSGKRVEVGRLFLYFFFLSYLQLFSSKFFKVQTFEKLKTRIFVIINDLLFLVLLCYTVPQKGKFKCYKTI